MRTWVFVLIAATALAAFLWASDKITLEGERTVFTVECRGGAWHGTQCSGELKAADQGEPVPDTSGLVRPFHGIAKWRWYLSRSGVPVGSSADN